MEFCGYNFFLYIVSFFPFFVSFRFVSLSLPHRILTAFESKISLSPYIQRFSHVYKLYIYIYIYRDTKIADGPFIYGFLFYSILFQFFLVLFSTIQFNDSKIVFYFNKHISLYALLSISFSFSLQCNKTEKLYTEQIWIGSIFHYFIHKIPSINLKKSI